MLKVCQGSGRVPGRATRAVESPSPATSECDPAGTTAEAQGGQLSNLRLSFTACILLYIHNIEAASLLYFLSAAQLFNNGLLADLACSNSGHQLGTSQDWISIQHNESRGRRSRQWDIGVCCFICLNASIYQRSR